MNDSPATAPARGPDHRHADLDGGEIPLRLGLQAVDGLRPAVSGVRQGLHAALPARDERDLRSGKERVKEDQNRDERQNQKQIVGH